MTEKIRIGIIGNGYIGNVHAGIYARDPRVEIAALYDILPDRSEALARRVGGKACSSQDELLDLSDAVLVCAPNRTHRSIATAAVEAGKHVFCEKPFSIGIEDAGELLRVAEAGGRVFQVGHNRRFAPVYRALKAKLADDPPHSAHIKMNRGELLKPEWTGDVNVTGGFLYETTIHYLDMLRFQFGEIAELVGFGSQHEYPEIDEFSVIVKFKSGFHCTFASSADASWLFPFERIEVFCHHRSIITEEMVRILDCRGTDPDFQTETFHMLEEEVRRGFVQEDAAFVDSILNGTPPAVSALDGYKSVELVEAVYRAVRTGERVTFD